MNKKGKVFVVGQSTEYANWLNMDLTDSLPDADVVLFTGGEDVSPVLYDEKQGSSTISNRKRDIEEVAIFKEAFTLGKHLLGICRGAQLLCVLSGGKLVQHQQNNHSYHDIVIDNKGNTVLISSTHHQSQYPYNMDESKYKVLAYTSDEYKSRYHMDGNDAEISSTPFKEVEIAYYPETKSLGIQGHPEYLVSDRKNFGKTLDYLTNLLNNFLNDKL